MGSLGPPSSIRYQYTFRFRDATQQRFDIALDAATLELRQSDLARSAPGWTKLTYEQCEGCPLGPATEYCPIAVNLAPIAETFTHSSSSDRAIVTVRAAERTYQKETTLEDGLRSMLGIYMVTSNCPVMDQLRPNVRFHLPFASAEETIYRAVAMYLVDQYFRTRRGEEADWNLRGIAAIYEGVSRVNRGMSRRLQAASREDANLNAVAILSTFGETLRRFLADWLEKIEQFFPRRD
jgi:hypothetical protein